MSPCSRSAAANFLLLFLSLFSLSVFTLKASERQASGGESRAEEIEGEKKS